MSVNASCVRGNHEDRVLLVHKDLHSQHLALPGHHSDIFWKEPESPVDQLDAQGFPHGEYIDRQLAQSLTQNQIDYLSSCPVILRVGQINGMGEVSVVHAGLMPGVSLEKQDPLAVMTMKSIDLDTYVPEPDHSGAPWTKVCFYPLPHDKSQHPSSPFTDHSSLPSSGTNINPSSPNKTAPPFSTATTPTPVFPSPSTPRA